MAFTTIFSNKANSQCRQQVVYYCLPCCKCLYLQDFNTKLTENNRETKWTVVLNKDYRYMFNLCTPEGHGRDDVIITLYDSQLNVCGSTYNKDIKRNIEWFQFICQESGNYYISATHLKLDSN